MDIADNLRTETVRHAGPLAAVCVEPDTPVRRVLEVLAELGRGAVLIARQGRLVGIFTERDALKLMASGGEMDGSIEGLMTRDPVSVEQSDSIGTAIGRMSARGYRRLPILDEAGRPVGLLDAAGVIHWLVQHFPSAVYNLPPVTNPATQEREGP